MILSIKRLYSGYYHIRGNGPCEWCQPDRWPNPSQYNFFPEASEAFRREVVKADQEAQHKGSPR